MAKIKHKLFQLQLNNLGKISEKYDSGILKEMNDFLEDGKRIYVNHSITTTGVKELVNAPRESIEKAIAYNHTGLTGPQHKQAYTHFRYLNSDKYVIISLIYKELEEDEIEDGIFNTSSMKLPNTKKALGKPDVQSEADKYIVKKDK